jgi:putative NADH-flavin reductase
MSLSFSFAATPFPLPAGKRNILVTGADGHIGSYFCQHAHEKYNLTLLLRSEKKADAVRSFGRLITADLADLTALAKACQGIDTVVHLAGQASPSATWDDLLHSNIVGTYNMMIAAKAAGCRRLIYASSIHAASGYPRDVQSKPSDPPNPGDLYGVTKCFGEALGRYMAEQEKLSIIALRIGGFQPPESAQGDTGVQMLDAWVSRRDLQQLIEKCIENSTLQFAIFNALSDNRFKRLDISSARELVGYRPQDDTTEENPTLKPLHLEEKVTAHNQTDPANPEKSGIREELGQARSVAQ